MPVTRRQSRTPPADAGVSGTDLLTDLLTTDCFDTVITRGLGEPRQVGYVVAGRLRREGLLTTGTEAYVEARERAEHLARRRYGPGRTLDDVARELVELLALPPGAAGHLVDVEVDVELALTREVPGAAALLAAERARGRRVGFLSDTPMTGVQVRVLLERCGVLAADDLVWTSSGLAAEKGEGEAYAAVVADLGGRPARWRHRGDNRRSDVLMARLSGVAGSWAPAAQLTGDERRLDRAAPATAGTSSALAGASRRARLLLAAEGDADPRTPGAAAVVGPLLVGYALWALQRCVATSAPALRVRGPGASVLLDVLRPLAAVVAPDVVVCDLGDASQDGGLVLHPPGAASGPGLHLVRTVAAGDAVGARGSAAPDPGNGGWLRDDVTGTGSVEADVDAALLVAALAHLPHPGPALVAREVAPLLDLLPWRADLRGPVLAVARRLHDDPSAAEALAWPATAPRLSWPAARSASGSPLRRAGAHVVGRARSTADVLRRKASRGVVLVRSRLAATRATRGSTP